MQDEAQCTPTASPQLPTSQPASPGSRSQPWETAFMARFGVETAVLCWTPTLAQPQGQNSVDMQLALPQTESMED